jgi:plasmid stabilization system protein ParE
VKSKAVRWSRLAYLDLESAHGYLEGENPSAARRFAAAILRAIENLERHPQMGAVARDLQPVGTYRHVVCGHHRIIYRIDGEVLHILRVWDTRRNPEDLRAE